MQLLPAILDDVSVILTLLTTREQGWTLKLPHIWCCSSNSNPDNDGIAMFFTTTSTNVSLQLPFEKEIHTHSNNFSRKRILFPSGQKLPYANYPIVCCLHVNCVYPDETKEDQRVQKKSSPLCNALSTWCLQDPAGGP